MFSFFRRQKDGDKRAGGKGDKDKNKDGKVKEKYTSGLSSPATSAKRKDKQASEASEREAVFDGVGVEVSVIEELPTASKLREVLAPSTSSRDVRVSPWSVAVPDGITAKASPRLMSVVKDEVIEVKVNDWVTNASKIAPRRQELPTPSQDKISETKITPRAKISTSIPDPPVVLPASQVIYTIKKTSSAINSDPPATAADIVINKRSWSISTAKTPTLSVDSPTRPATLVENKTGNPNNADPALPTAHVGGIAPSLAISSPTLDVISLDPVINADIPQTPAQVNKETSAIISDSPLPVTQVIKETSSLISNSPLPAAQGTKKTTTINPDVPLPPTQVIQNAFAMNSYSPLPVAQEVKTVFTNTSDSPLLADQEVKKMSTITSESPLPVAQVVNKTLINPEPATQVVIKTCTGGPDPLVTVSREGESATKTSEDNTMISELQETKEEEETLRVCSALTPLVTKAGPRSVVDNRTAELNQTSGCNADETGDRTSDMRSLESQEKKYQEQLAELRAQIAAKETETNKLCYRIEELQRDFVEKSGGMDRLQAELVAAHQESQCTRQKLRLLENDVADYRQKNDDLADELLKKSDDSTEDKAKNKDSDDDDDDNEKEEDDDDDEEDEDDNSEQIAQLEANVKEMEEKMKEMKKELEQIRLERDQLEEERAEMEAEREEEMKIVQDALEEVNEEKTLIRSEFETFRTVNTDREQKLLDDFEWKLREVEQTCKRRLEEKERRVTDTISSMEMKIKEAEERLSEIERLRVYETEVVQLRGISRDQQRSLRQATSKTEELQVSELILKEEVSRLRSAVEKEKAIKASMLATYEKRTAELEKKCQAQIESQKSEMNDQWEHRLRRECLRLKTELVQTHEEEKHLALEALKIQKDQEAQTCKQTWERRLHDTLKEVSTLKICIAEKEAHFQKELERAQSNADSDILELRRKMDKMDMSYQGQIEKMNENHEKEMEQLNWETGRKIHQMEQNWQLQNSSTRTTLELVKDQMERDSQSKLETAAYKHRLELEEQWQRLVQEKEEHMQQLEENHLKQLQKVRDEFEGSLKSVTLREAELVEQNISLKEQLKETSCQAGLLANNADFLHGNLTALNQQIVQVQQQADNTMRVREQQLEVEKQAHLERLREQHRLEHAEWQVQYQTMHEQLWHKIDCLSKSVSDHEQQLSRPEDVALIADLQRIIAELEHKKLYGMRDQEQQTTNPERVSHDQEQQTTQPEIVMLDEEQQTSQLENVMLDKEQQTSENVMHDEAQQTSQSDDVVNVDAKISRPEDVALIAELKRVIALRERELASVTEEKTFYELELLSHETSCNNIVTESYTGVLNPHKYTHRPKKKGGGRGGTSLNESSALTKSRSQTLANQTPETDSNVSAASLLRSRSFEYPAIKVPSRSPTRKAKKPSKTSQNITISTL